MANPTSTSTVEQIHPPALRLMHWMNALAMVIMIGSGWRIYNDSALIEGFYFPNWLTLGGDPTIADQKWQNHASGGLLWHFAAMWVLVINGFCYLTYGFYTGRFQRMLWPVSIDGVKATILSTLKGRLDHEHGIYNDVQRLLYMGVVVLAVVIVMSGLAIWKPVQFYGLAALFGSFQGARWVHFVCMTGIVLFLLVHVVLALLVPQTLVSMTIGDSVNDPKTPVNKGASS